jgi:hypothetical protein
MDIWTLLVSWCKNTLKSVSNDFRGFSGVLYKSYMLLSKTV